MTEYSLSYTNLNTSQQFNHSVPADSPYLHLHQVVQPGAQYNSRLAARSQGWGKWGIAVSGSREPGKCCTNQPFVALHGKIIQIG